MTLTDLYEQRRHLQFRYDNSSWQSGPDYRARIAAIDAQIRAKTAAQAHLKQLALDAVHSMLANHPTATPDDAAAALHDAANDAPLEYERAISEGVTA